MVVTTGGCVSKEGYNLYVRTTMKPKNRDEDAESVLKISAKASRKNRA